MRCGLPCLVAIAFVVAAASRAGAAADELGTPLRLDAVIAYARQHNPEIRTAQAKWRAAGARPAQAGALPDPMLDLAYHNESLDRLPLGSSEFTWLQVGASQELPFPGKLGLKRVIAAREAERMGEDARRVELDVIARVKIAYAEYAHLHALLDLLRRDRELLRKLARAVEAKYAVGQGIQQDVLRAQVELSLLMERETTLEQRRESETAALNALLDRPASAPLGMAEHLEERHLKQTLEDLTAAALAHAPEVRAADRRVAGGESMVALARREYLPDFVVRADYLQKAALLPEWQVGLGIKVPLYAATKQRAGVEEATAELAAAHAAGDGARRDAEARIRDLYARARASERLIALYHTTVLPQAGLALEAATSAYSVGKVDFLTVLNSFTVSLEYEMRYHEELSNFQKATAELEAVVGAPVED